MTVVVAGAWSWSVDEVSCFMTVPSAPADGWGDSTWTPRALGVCVSILTGWVIAGGAFW
ncbi:MAG TPA: hypothetical protein VN181_12115 [Thermoanaerobaculia bacterium]|nr:hypothetical protein [Thermoanaerobaculia bacterium]